MNGIAYPVVREGDDEIAQLRARVQQLEKINSALMDRVERSIDMEGGAFSMFETAIALESVVRDRTSALEAAMSELNRVIAELAAANDDATAARILLRDAIETLNDGFALFDANASQAGIQTFVTRVMKDAKHLALHTCVLRGA